MDVYHQKIFEKLLNRHIGITTFDITINHLLDEKRIIEHDCTLPLPGGLYTITYAHVLLKFIETEKQWDVIKNSYDALEFGGLAIHVMDKNDYETLGEKLPDGYFSVPLGRWIEKLNLLNIKHQEIPIKYGKALLLFK